MSSTAWRPLSIHHSSGKHCYYTYIVITQVEPSLIQYTYVQSNQRETVCQLCKKWQLTMWRPLQPLLFIVYCYIIAWKPLLRVLHNHAMILQQHNITNVSTSTNCQLSIHSVVAIDSVLIKFERILHSTNAVWNHQKFGCMQIWTSITSCNTVKRDLARCNHAMKPCCTFVHLPLVAHMHVFVQYTCNLH